MQHKADMYELEERYVIVTAACATIVAAPDTNSVIVAHTQQGDVFQLHSVKGQWYEISMFSSTRRYLQIAQARKITLNRVSLPTDSATRHALFKAIADAESRARTEDVGHDGLLMDQYILEVARAFKIGVLEYGLIAVEGFEKGWDV
jgi:hypothetical protein